MHDQPNQVVELQRRALLQVNRRLLECPVAIAKIQQVGLVGVARHDQVHEAVLAHVIKHNVPRVVRVHGLPSLGEPAIARVEINHRRLLIVACHDIHDAVPVQVRHLERLRGVATVAR